MHNFKTGFKLVKYFLKSNLYLGRVLEEWRKPLRMLSFIGGMGETNQEALLHQRNGGNKSGCLTPSEEWRKPLRMLYSIGRMEETNQDALLHQRGC